MQSDHFLISLVVDIILRGLEGLLVSGGFVMWLSYVVLVGFEGTLVFEL